MKDWMGWIGFAVEKLSIMVGSVLALLILGGLVLLVLHVGLKFKTRNSSSEPPWLEMVPNPPEPKTPAGEAHADKAQKTPESQETPDESPS